MVGTAAAPVSNMQHSMASVLQASRLETTAQSSFKARSWSGAAAAYGVWAEVIVILAEAAKSLDRQDCIGHNEVMIRNSQSCSTAPLLCCLIPLPAVLAADVGKYPKVG